MKYFNLSLQTTLIEHLEGGLKQVIKILNLKKKKDFKIKHIFKQLQCSLKSSVADMYIL